MRRLALARKGARTTGSLASGRSNLRRATRVGNAAPAAPVVSGILQTVQLKVIITKGAGAGMSEKSEWLSAVLAKSKDFVDILTYCPFGDGEWFYTAGRLAWVAEDPDHIDVRVPVGFVTDLTSIPSAFYGIMPRDGVYLSAAVVHDYLYWVQDRPRPTADEIFNVAMTQLKVPLVKRSVIVTAVSAFGEAAWKENARLRAGGEKRVLKRFPKHPRITWTEWKLEADVFADDQQYEGFQNNPQDSEPSDHDRTLRG